LKPLEVKIDEEESKAVQQEEEEAPIDSGDAKIT
jgi:hypothetical protein